MNFKKLFTKKSVVPPITPTTGPTPFQYIQNQQAISRTGYQPPKEDGTFENSNNLKQFDQQQHIKAMQNNVQNGPKTPFRH